MTAIQITRPGPPGVLEAASVPVPLLDDGAVLIRVHAAGVNRPDLLQRRGLYPPPPGVTDIPGLEVAGEVVDSRAPDWRPGDRVCALLAGGGYAAYATVSGAHCLPLPDTASWEDGACLPETLYTVWDNLVVRGRLHAGDKVLIHGGASGIGTTAIQMAKLLDATVIVTAGTDEKCAYCRDIGADRAINYKTDNFVAVLKESYPEGVQIVLDMVGGDYVNRNLDVLAPEGRHVSIAFLNGRDATINIQTIMKKRLILTGSTLRDRSAAEKAALTRAIRTHIWPHVEAGRLKPVIHARFPLQDAAQAHKMLEDGNHVGKIVLNVL